MHLTPVGIYHIRSCRDIGELSELSHHLTPGEYSLRAAGILDICQHLLELRRILQSLSQRPSAVGIQVYPCIRERLLECLYRLELLCYGEYTALELEVLEAVLIICSLSQRYDMIGIHSLLMAQPVPVAVAVLLGYVGHIGSLSVSYIEEIAEESDGLSLDTVSEQRCHRNLEILAEDVQHSRLDSCHYVHARAQIVCLIASDIIRDML